MVQGTQTTEPILEKKNSFNWLNDKAWPRAVVLLIIG